VTIDLDDVYRSRFSDEEAAAKDRIWREIARFLERYVPHDAAVLDVACDRGDFIRNVRAREKWAVDVRDVARYLPADVRFVRTNGLTLDDALPNDHFDVVFVSNYLEHLPSSGAVVDQMRAIQRVLKRGGRMIVLQPNIRLVGGRYWDFIDHHVALTDRSLVEAAELAGFRPHAVIKRFLPYNTKTRMPKAAGLVRAYLKVRPAWLLLGKQTLLVAEKR
jgi:ubiquinone/menaquinone biosynthesis C-methylase UbiE